MKFTLTGLSALLCASSVAALDPAQKLQKRLQDKSPVIERRVPAQPFESQRLQKRASKFLNENTQSKAVSVRHQKFKSDSHVRVCCRRYWYSRCSFRHWRVVRWIASYLFSGQRDKRTFLLVKFLFFTSGSDHRTQLGFFLKVFFNDSWFLTLYRFFPSENPAAAEEILIWFNGGPGCSSLIGLLSENGPFTWEAGTIAPTKNAYSWVNLTNVMWVEQPVGVGFSQGISNITNEVELGQEFIGFYKSFVNAFQAQNFKVYLTGESYGGYYTPYIADAFIKADDPVYYNLAGMAINDPIIGDYTLQEQGMLIATAGSF